MNAGIGIGLYIIFLIIGLFLLICGVMTAIIVPNYMHLAGWDWIFVFFSTLGVVLGSGGGTLITINRSK